MAVLVEGISVILQLDAIAENYPDGWEGFVRYLSEDRPLVFA
jgi:hypothetical protein